jgi:hypothetical protein
MSRPFNTTMADQFVALGAPKPCFKVGYISKGAAEAHIRSLIKNNDRRPDKKHLQPLLPYKCEHRSCRKLPWHAGHPK